MKLLAKYSRINFFTTVVIFLCANFAFYFLLHFIFVKQLDDDLQTEQTEIRTYAASHGALPAIIPSEDEITEYHPSPVAENKVKYSSVVLTADKETFRRIEFYVSIGEKHYKIAVAKSLENSEHIISSFILVSAITILLLLLAGFLINRILLRRLWKPFYTSMKQMREYRITQHHVPEFSETKIEEFTELNLTLTNTLQQAEREFRSLREFTENASHELQTPVAIIRSKLDVMIQDENLSESQSRLVQECYDAIERLDRLNRGLLLLMKIDNRQFPELSEVNLQDMIGEKQLAFHELMLNKDLRCELMLENIFVKMNPVLADILLNNLFSNAIRHSSPGSIITVELTKGKLKFSNGPANTALNDDALFRRFHKGGNFAERNGLGLAIIKEICTVSGFSVGYEYDKKMHQFVIQLDVGC